MARSLENVEWEKNENGTNLIIVKPIDRNGAPWTFKRVVEHYGYPLFSKRVANAIRTYRHAKSQTTRQHSIDYINRNFKKYDKYKEYNISDKCCEVLKKNPIKKKAKELGMKCSIIGILASESYQRCFLQQLFGQSCKPFLDIVACPNWTKLQRLRLAA